MTLKVGDRVRVLAGTSNAELVGREFTIEKLGFSGQTARFPGEGPAQHVHFNNLTKIEEPKSVPFKLERGDKVVNRKTGRRGVVIYGMVHDDQPPFEAPVPAAALEEYEAWHPGTYDLIKKDAPW